MAGGATILLLIFLFCIAESSPPGEPIACQFQNTNCTITNAYGSYPDRTTCRAGEVAYPRSEEDLLSAVANATRAKRKMKAATRYSQSIPKLSCPGGGDGDGLLISTRYLDRVVGLDAAEMTVTAEGGARLKEVMAAAAEAGLALTHTPYWWGLTVGGALATGAHGSSLWGKGGALHEYVVGIRIVTPASAGEGYAKVVSLDASHPHLDAAKVSLGVLGVISQVTLKLEPLFKRSITHSWSDDSDLAERVVDFGREHEFASVNWFPGHGKVLYVIDDRLESDAPGDGRFDFIGFRPIPTLVLALNRVTEESTEAEGSTGGKCMDSEVVTSMIRTSAYGLTNDGVLFTGFPVVGYHNHLQSSGSCLDSPGDALLTACAWDPRVRGLFFHQTTVSVALPKAGDFVRDVQQLRDLDPSALCGVELYNGILMRYVKASTAHLGKQEDAVDFDITYYRSRDPTAPRLGEDVLEEIEQMALLKYGGLPHWGKNRNLAFDGAAAKYGRSGEFLEVKALYDPDGLFSSEWSDQVLGVGGRASVVREGCALEGLCVCSDDGHCAPDRGYFCRPGKVFKDARVCTQLDS